MIIPKIVVKYLHSCTLSSKKRLIYMNLRKITLDLGYNTLFIRLLL